MEFPASSYPKSIFEQSTPDQQQSLDDNPTFNVLLKGYKTRSMLYERLLPDNTSGALRLQGPRGGNTAIIMDNKGSIKIKTGPKNTEIAGSGILGIKTQGQQQLHEGRSNIQYNPGGSENEGQALNVLAYGDVVEETVGHTRYMKAQKIYIKATDELIIEGQNIKIQAGAELQMSGTKIATAQVNKKEIVTGQDLKFGAGESSDVKFDPRSSTNIVSAGCINHKVAGDYALRALGNVHIGSLGGAGLLIKDRTMGMKITTLTRFAAGGKVDTKIASDGQSIITGKAGVKVTTPTKLDMEGNVSATLESDVAVTVGKPGTANTKVKGAKTTLSATGNMIISGANIYLN
tara:strand:+ start:976 stop:2016 length:1041 start_codon:yes stop_codon:yes gene_type:complete